jgi:hypothetical protein
LEAFAYLLSALEAFAYLRAICLVTALRSAVGRLRSRPLRVEAATVEDILG